MTDLEINQRFDGIYKLLNDLLVSGTPVEAGSFNTGMNSYGLPRSTQKVPRSNFYSIKSEFMRYPNVGEFQNRSDSVNSKHNQRNSNTRQHGTADKTNIFDRVRFDYPTKLPHEYNTPDGIPDLNTDAPVEVFVPVVLPMGVFMQSLLTGINENPNIKDDVIKYNRKYIKKDDMFVLLSSGKTTSTNDDKVNLNKQHHKKSNKDAKTILIVIPSYHLTSDDILTLALINVHHEGAKIKYSLYDSKNTDTPDYIVGYGATNPATGRYGTYNTDECLDDFCSNAFRAFEYFHGKRTENAFTRRLVLSFNSTSSKSQESLLINDILQYSLNPFEDAIKAAKNLLEVALITDQINLLKKVAGTNND